MPGSQGGFPGTRAGGGALSLVPNQRHTKGRAVGGEGVEVVFTLVGGRVPCDKEVVEVVVGGRDSPLHCYPLNGLCQAVEDEGG